MGSPTTKQPWLYTPLADSVFLLSPAFVVTALVWLFPDFFGSDSVPPGLWLLLVVGVDVSHVYSTLYRTYMDKEESRKYRSLLILIPIACWIVGILLYTNGSLSFWRTLAYLAVFHFVRQQYGFLRLYSRKEKSTPMGRGIDATAVYMAAVYPMIYWHTHPRSFGWFINGDLMPFRFAWLETLALAIYIASLLLYCGKALIEWRRVRTLNLPKHLIVAGTAVSWYTGIVQFNADLAFTVTNVVAHGIPYMALVWIYQRKKRIDSWYLRPHAIPIYAGMLFLIAYVEESFWDVLVWRDHTEYFAWLAVLPQLDNHALLSLVVPLLAVPQATHYVLDGFIWRVRDMRT